MNAECWIIEIEFSYEELMKLHSNPHEIQKLVINEMKLLELVIHIQFHLVILGLWCICIG